MRSLLALFCLFVSTASASTYPTDTISFTSRTTRDWYLMKHTIIEVYSSESGHLATLTSNRMRSDVKLHLQEEEPAPKVDADGETVFKNIQDIRTRTDVFGEIGFPQLASLAIIRDSLYGIILTTKIDVEPEMIGSIDSDDPVVKAQFYEDLRKRTGVSGNFGTKLGGVYPPALYDNAVLVRWEDGHPVVLKVYNIVANNLPEFYSSMDVYNVIYDYAHAQAMRTAYKRPLTTCEAQLVLR